MRTVVTYLDKDKNRTTRENAWTVMTQVYNDAGNLQRTGYSFGEAQLQASAAANETTMLCLRDTESGELLRVRKNLVKIGRNEDCDIVCSQKEDKRRSTRFTHPLSFVRACGTSSTSPKQAHG